MVRVAPHVALESWMALARAPRQSSNYQMLLTVYCTVHTLWYQIERLWYLTFDTVFTAC